MGLAAPAVQSGDLIFHQSQSRQAAAIFEATGSRWSHVGIILEDTTGTAGERWIVAEASMPVRITPLKKFIARGRGGHYRVYRARALKSSQLSGLRSAIQDQLGKPYDIYFEWADDAIYCSELVYKVFLAAVGIELGSVQKFSDLKLDGPYVQAMIKHRLTNTGRKLNLNEPIVTPIAQMRDTDLDLVIRTGP